MAQVDAVAINARIFDHDVMKKRKKHAFRAKIDNVGIP